MTVVGLTALDEQSANGHTYTKTNAAYIHMIERHEALPFVLPAFSRIDRAQAMLDRIDALVLTGGGDINPALYGAAPSMATTEVDTKRDSFEIALALAAINRGIPTLGICRGMQIINVALGGTLHQDVSASPVTHRRGLYDYENTHPVRLEKDTQLHRIMGRTRMEFSSEHHQAVHRVGSGLKVAARASDGIIEAIEHEHLPFVVGLQAHPEHQGAAFDPLFKAFLRAPKRSSLEVALRRFAHSQLAS